MLVISLNDSPDATGMENCAETTQVPLVSDTEAIFVVDPLARLVTVLVAVLTVPIGVVVFPAIYIPFPLGTNTSSL